MVCCPINHQEENMFMSAKVTVIKEEGTSGEGTVKQFSLDFEDDMNASILFQLVCQKVSIHTNTKDHIEHWCILDIDGCDRGYIGDITDEIDLSNYRIIIEAESFGEWNSECACSMAEEADLDEMAGE